MSPNPVFTKQDNNEGNFYVINGNPMGITMGPDAGVYLSYPERKIEKLFD